MRKIFLILAFCSAKLLHIFPICRGSHFQPPPLYFLARYDEGFNKLIQVNKIKSTQCSVPHHFPSNRYNLTPEAILSPFLAIFVDVQQRKKRSNEWQQEIKDQEGQDFSSHISQFFLSTFYLTLSFFLARRYRSFLKSSAKILMISNWTFWCSPKFFCSQILLNGKNSILYFV